MTKSRGRLVPAVLVALAAGAGTAGVTTVLAAPPVEDATPSPVALNLTSPPGTPPPPPSPAAPSPASAATTTETAQTTTTVVPTTTTTTTTTRAPSTTASTEPTTDPPLSADAQVLAIVNDARADAGCAPVKLDARLTEAGQRHSEDMSDQDYFSHTSLDGRSFVDRAKAAGYRSPGAENIARGQRTPEQVMAAWMDSPGHRANILNCDLKTMGLGLETDGYYWTQLFGY